MCETDKSTLEKPVRSITSLRKCRVCGCTESDCRQCIAVTGVACHWVEVDLCSRCRAEEVLVHGQPTAWNYAQAIKAIAAAEVQRDCVCNGIRRILEGNFHPAHEDDMRGVLEDLKYIHHIALAIGPGEVTQRLAITLGMFLADNDFRKGEGDLDNVDSDEIKEARALLELMT